MRDMGHVVVILDEIRCGVCVVAIIRALIFKQYIITILVCLLPRSFLQNIDMASIRVNRTTMVHPDDSDRLLIQENE